MHYYARLNSQQYTRYTHLLEPLMSMIYSLRSGHQNASHTLENIQIYLDTQDVMKRCTFRRMFA